MLKALQERKYIRLDEGQLASAESWLDLYAEVEDLLTATVFERLAYLSPRSLGPLLLALDPERHLPGDWEGFSDFTFWPRWQLPSGATREPDVSFLGHPSDGAPPTRFVVENKRENIRQDPYQWGKELEALENSVGVDSWTEVVLLALGGADRPISSLKQAFQDHSSRFRSVSVIGGSWYQLLAAVDEQLRRTSPGAAEARILEDIRAALNLHGIRPHYWLGEFPAQIRGMSINDAGWRTGRALQPLGSGATPIAPLDWRQSTPEPIQTIQLAFNQGENQ